MADRTSRGRGTATCIAMAAAVALAAGATAAPASRSSGVALLTYVDARGELCGMHADGSHRVRLVGAPTSAPAWSPDGRYVAFARWTHRAEIFVVDASGRVRWHFGLNGYDSGQPVWAPDGRHIAYSLFSAHGGGLAVAQTDGANDHHIVPNAPGAWPPDELSGAAWTSDGQRLAYINQATSKTPEGIYTVNVDGGDRQLLIADAFDAAFSPDGTKLAYVGLHGSGLVDGIYIADADGGNPRALTASPLDAAPTWSPNGKSIAFFRGDSIVVVNADGSNERVIASRARLFAVWSPDSRLIAFTRSPTSVVGNRPFTSSIVVARADGGGERVVLQRRSTTPVEQPAWRLATALPPARRPPCTGPS